MKSNLAIATVLSLLLSGCASANIDLRSTNSPGLGASAPPMGSAYSSGFMAIQAEVSPGAYFGLAALAYIMFGIQDNVRSSGEGASSRLPPGLAGDRAVAERDCSRPFEPLHANLRCK